MDNRCDILLGVLFSKGAYSMYEILPDILFVLIALFCVTSIAVFATTIYFHRALAHDAIRIISKGFERFLCIAVSITTGLKRDEWVAIHRKHHTFTDKEGDPHSPYVFGFWKVQLFNVYYYIREARTPGIVKTFAPDISSRSGDSMALRGYRGLAVGIAVLIVTGVVFSLSQGDSVLYGVCLGLLVAAVHAILYVFVLSPSINGLCHWRGVKRFPDTPAYNNRLLGWLVAGEGLHNNHHKYPSAPKFSIFRGDVDPAWPVINLFVKARLVVLRGKIGTPLSVAPQETAPT